MRQRGETMYRDPIFMRKVRTSALQKRASFIELALAAAILTPSVGAFAQEAPAAAPEPKATAPKAAAPKAPDTGKAPAAATPAPPPSGEGAQAEPAPATEGEGDSAAAPDEAGAAPPETTAPDAGTPDAGTEYSTETGMTPLGGSATGGLTADGQSGADFGAFPNPAEDQKALEKQGEERPKDVEPDRVFAEDWWSHTRPTLELHGNFRVRASLYHNFALNRIDSPGAALWPRPADDRYTDLNNAEHGATACTPDETKSGSNDDPASADQGCVSRTQGGADMRFRLEPDIVISDNLRIRSQIDLLGNLVMGSTAQGNSNFYAATGSSSVGPRSGYSPVSAQTSSADSPVSGVNSLQDAITVRRAWAEYETPVGELKFGRMPDHWGLGILRNAGDDIDADYQSTVDRIAFFTGLPSMSLYAGGAWDYMHEGATSAGFTPPGGQPYDLSQRDDLSRMNLMLFRKMDAQLEELALKKGKVVLNGGLYLTYQWQRLAADKSASCDSGGAAIGCSEEEATTTYTRRGFKMWTPDVYAEIKYKKFYAGLEVVTHQGKYDSLEVEPGPIPDNEDGWKIRQWAVAGEIEQRLVEDRLLLGFYSGWASGDPDVDSLVPPDGLTDADTQIDDRTISTFRFHPGYRVDLILNRHLLSRVQGSYYVKPMAQYDFIRKTNGMKVGGRAEAIWTRASTPMQTPGHHRDLGIELNGSVYYQSSDGSLNDRRDLKGGFYSMAQYGVLFPLSGLGYQDAQTPENLVGVDQLKLKPAQLVRVFLGVAF
jgi:uncharacterized protein (TIGR04551 family)